MSGKKLEPVRVLYISYDGMLEPLGESQVVNYVERLAADYAVTLLSFEKSADFRDVHQVAKMRQRLVASNISWIPLRYHKWPPIFSTAFDVVSGLWKGFLWSWKRGPRLVHARGYVAAVIALALKKAAGVPFLFDMRGFWADEKVDGGHWSRGSALYRLAKWFERHFFESADAIVSLTSEGVNAFPSLGYRIRESLPVEVIPTCTDLERFCPGPKDADLALRLGVSGHLVIGCAGTMSNWYLRQPMLTGLSYLSHRLENVVILIVTQEEHERLRSDALQAGIAEGQLVLVQAPFPAMPAYIRLMDLGLFFIKECFSKKGSSATKLGEFLATGVPVIINDGIGDSARIIRASRAGVVLASPDPRELRAASADIEALLRDPQVSNRCRQAARQYFDLIEGTRKYDALYARLLDRWVAEPTTSPR